MTDGPEFGSPSLIQPQLLVALIVIAAVAIAGELAGLLNLFGIETIPDATTLFLVMVLGGYLGIVISDRLWWRAVTGN